MAKKESLSLQIKLGWDIYSTLNKIMLTRKIILLTVFLFIFSPWVLRGGGDISGGNLSKFLSFKLLFFDASIFQNIGKETGIVYPSFLPFAAYGVYRQIKAGKLIGIISGIGLLIIASVSAGRLIKQEFFVIVILITYFTAIGLFTLKRQRSRTLRALMWLGVLSIIYEISQYAHYIRLHYPHDLPVLGIQ